MLWLTPADIKESGSSNSGSCDQASNFITLSTPGHSEESSKAPLLSSDRHSKHLTTRVKVHFTYDELKFPKIIKIDHNSEFYMKVFSALSNKKSGSKPCHLKYRVGVMWYDFTKDIDFEDLCMDESNPEIFIKARSTAADSTLSGTKYQLHN